MAARIWLINSPGSGGRTMRRTGGARMRQHKQGGGAVAKRRKGTKNRGKVSVVRRHKKNRAAFSVRRRHSSSGGGAMSGGLVKVALNGMVNAAQILGGKVAVRIVPGLVGIVPAGYVGLLMQAGIAVALGYGAHKFAGPRLAANVLHGALLAPVESLAKNLTAGVPMLAAAFSDEPVLLSSYPRQLGSYPRNTHLIGEEMGDEVDSYA